MQNKYFIIIFKSNGCWGFYPTRYVIGFFVNKNREGKLLSRFWIIIPPHNSFPHGIVYGLKVKIKRFIFIIENPDMWIPMETSYWANKVYFKI
jgi:hypothetical protein